jgi:hypothetical protein
MTKDHLVSLAGGWSIWKWVRLRGAGFGARGVLRLAAPTAVTALDRWSAAERELAGAQERAVSALQQTISTLAGDQRTAAIRVLRKVRDGKLPVLDEQLSFLRPALEEIEAVRTQLASARTLYEQAFEHEQARLVEALRDVASDPRFREAIAWQNPNATPVLDWARRGEPATDKKLRRAQQLVGSYWQRYCVKNESVGFFGPQGLALVDPAVEVIEVIPGSQLLKKRSVHFEYWAIGALAAVLAEDSDLKLDLAPRRLPTVFIEGNVVHYPIDRENEVEAEIARVLAACDGMRSARSLASELAGESFDEHEVYAILSELEEQNLIAWTLELPTGPGQPERELRRLLETTGTAGQRGLQALDEIEATRDAIAAAAGDAEETTRTLEALKSTFERITSRAGSRKAGQLYAARTLVYEDTFRDIEVRLGPRFFDKLAQPMSLILDSARWLTYRVAQDYLAAFEDAYTKLAAESSSPTIDYLKYWESIRHLFGKEDKAPPLVEAVVDELHRHWYEILQVDPSARRHSLTFAQIEPAFRAAFSAPHPGWPSARYHSPDLMVAARDVDAIRRGDCTFVLGEIHVAMNTCSLRAFMNQLDDPDALIRAREIDLPKPILMPVISREEITSKHLITMSRNAVDLEIGRTRSWRGRDHVIAVGELVIERRDGQLIVRDRKRTREFFAMEFFDTYLTAEVARTYGLLAHLPHLPRITLDDFVLTRESWTFAPETMKFADESRGATQFAGARAWAKSHDLPRWVFAKVPEERKPIFVDFDSPLYVELFCRLVRGGSRLTVSEMLPDVDDCWLQDGLGGTNTCELRVAAVDETTWRPT